MIPLVFQPALPLISENAQYAIFACGCFWGAEYWFSKEFGVLQTVVGFTGGETQSPSYREVSLQKTGHFESVYVVFDINKTNYETLCKLFFEIHDPGQLDGQGPDIGLQYRSAIFYHTSEQLQISQNLIHQLRGKGHIVETLILPEKQFYIAESNHQHYYQNNGETPYCHRRISKF